MIEPARASTAAAAFSRFFAENYGLAVRAAYLMTSSQAVAEDIAQDAFRQVLERWDEIDRPAGYLWRAITNGARSWGRRERRPPPPRLFAVGDTEPFDSDVLAVRAALARLPVGQRQALVLRHFSGMREREIADAMGCPIGTVRSHLRRGLHTMRRALS